jgi:hypothetical protein
MSVLSNKQVIVTTEATLVIDGNDDGCYINVKAHSAGPIYLGDSDVTIDNGYELAASESLHFMLGPNEELYAIVEEGTGTIYFLASMNQ